MTDDLLGNDTDESDAADADDRHVQAAGRAASTQTDDTVPAATDPGDGASPATTSTWRRWRERRRTRVSKWDRPPDPKDWRYFVGTLGKVLIATGILMFGFVAYQLWGTGIETARAQNALEDTFEAAVAANQVAADDADEIDEADEDLIGDGVDAAPDDETPTTTPTTTPIDDTDAADEPVDELEPSVGGRTPSAVVPGGIDLSSEAVVQNVPVVPEGDPIARMEIPRIGVEKYVVQGVTLDDLKKGPGHYPDTPLPGQLGNAAVAGHRTTYGAPFFDVDQLEPGDEIIVTMITGDRFVYTVTGSQVVTAADSWVIGTRDPNVAELTLTTCHPKYTARDRLIVHSVLDPEQSAQVGRPEFRDAEATSPGGTDEVADTDRPAGDDPTFDTGADAAADGAATQDDDAAAGDDSDDRTDAVFLDPTPDDADDGETTDGELETDDGASDEATAADTADETAAAGDDPDDRTDTVAVVDPDDAEIDAFSEGWFDDDDAWPQIALWGSILTVISLLAYQLSKKTRHDSIGFMVGIFPFLVALYFFFQNVNRLLPPGL